MYRVSPSSVSMSRDEFLRLYGSVFEVRGSTVVEMAREPEDDSRPTFWVHRFTRRDDAIRTALHNLEQRIRAALIAAQKRLDRSSRMRTFLLSFLAPGGNDNLENAETREWLKEEIAGYETQLAEMARMTAGTIPPDSLLDIHPLPDILTLAFAAKTGDAYWTVRFDVQDESVGLHIERGFLLRVTPRQMQDQPGHMDLHCEGEDGIWFSSRTRLPNGAFRGQTKGTFHHLSRVAAEQQARRMARNAAIGIADHILPERLVKRLSA